ncbi:MAG: Asp23/Gls24 family envelope stress response protein [Coriobacteriales bacterium]|nr:Asp23/Gls24 family envelope stress response protein [Coriobacteriales bacterium]
MVSLNDSFAIPGAVTVEEGVIQDMAGYAAMECYGVAGMAAPNFTDSLAKVLPRHKLRRGIIVKGDGDAVSLELYIVVQYGTNLSVVAENLAGTVRYYISEFLNIQVEDISINIQGVKK